MTRIFFFCLMLFLASRGFSQPADDFTLESIFQKSTYRANGPVDFKIFPDGIHYIEEDYGSKSLLIKTLDGKAAIDTFISQKSVQGLPEDFQPYYLSYNADFTKAILSSDVKPRFRHSYSSRISSFNKGEKTIKPLANGAHVYFPQYSPNSKMVSYIKENNLYVQAIDGMKETAITQDGEINKIINGMGDWVYEEEFALPQAYEWSPNSLHLAYLKFDERKVKEYSIPVYDGLYPSLYTYKYPVAGEDNSVVSLWVYHTAIGKTTQIDLGSNPDQYIPRIFWSQDNTSLYYLRLNRMQNHLEIMAYDLASGTQKNIYTEDSKTYVDIASKEYPDNYKALKDGGFILTSERDGMQSIYLLGKGGLKNLTPGQEVINILSIDEGTGLITYSAFDYTLGQAIYRVKTNGKSLVKVEPKGDKAYQYNSASPYTVKASVYPGAGYYTYSYEGIAQPQRQFLFDSKGKMVRELAENNQLQAKLENLYKSNNLKPRAFIRTDDLGDGTRLNGWMVKPANFDSSGRTKYPVLFMIYGGPGSQEVTADYNGSLELWAQYLASKGYMVVSFDNRGTGGRGAAFKKETTYKKLGIQESDDQIAAARWLAKKPYVDGGRIGMYGWSFGGYMSLMCITRGADVFKTVVAIAPVTDWRYYDNIYTERFMQRPIDNPEGYKASSVLTYVDKLKGNLLLIHGTFDDNVHPQNSFDLIKAMVEKNKKFDSEFYTNKNHSIYGGNTRLHLYQRVTDYLLANL